MYVELGYEDCSGADKGFFLGILRSRHHSVPFDVVAWLSGGWCWSNAALLR